MYSSTEVRDSLLRLVHCGSFSLPIMVTLKFSDAKPFGGW